MSYGVPMSIKGFKWEIKPPLGGHIGAVQIATESIDYGPVRDLRIEWVDPNLGTPEQKDFWTYEHLLTAGSTGTQPGTTPGVMLSHQYEAIPGGCKMRSCMHSTGWNAPRCRYRCASQGPSPAHPSGKKPSGGGWATHNIAEVSTFKAFLPALWGIWQAVPDPQYQPSMLTKNQKRRLPYYLRPEIRRTKTMETKTLNWVKEIKIDLFQL